MNTLSTSMRGDWLQRAAQAKATLDHALAAPALFDPKFVRQLGEDYKRAVGFARLWF